MKFSFDIILSKFQKLNMNFNTYFLAAFAVLSSSVTQAFFDDALGLNQWPTSNTPCNQKKD